MTRIRVSTSWVGPRCTVQLDDGRLIWGYRVAPDYVPTEAEVTYWGRCVHVVTRDRKTGIVVFVDGVQQTGASANGWSWLTTDDGVDEITDAEPPALRVVRRRAAA